jgi:ring-1,2-phenylacetyl-CoA epoxidase subunit PaaE
MATFHSLNIKEVRRETEDCVSIVLAVPNELADEFKFTPGQYLTFKKELAGEEVRRSYSICSAPYENELRVGVKKMPFGKFSSYVNDDLRVGDQLETMTPKGKFLFHSNAGASNHVVGIAGGSGVTPVLSILKDVLNSEPNSRFTLFYGNRSTSSVIFREQIELLKNEYLNRLSVYHVFSDEELGSDLFQGMMTKEKVSSLMVSLIDIKEVDGFYICGPEPMIIGAKDVLKEGGVNDEKVHFELFAASSSTPAPQTQTGEPKSTGPSLKSKVKVVMDGDDFELELATDGATLLDAATEAGLDVPFSCKGAVCCTCLARVKNGEATMEKNYSLSEKEVSEGLILTCQAHPTTKSVTFDFDDIW